MKHAILIPLLSICLVPLNDQLNYVEKAGNEAAFSVPVVANDESFNITSQEPANEKMLAVIFKAQKFCRAELKDFEFDAEFKVVSATVYFSGANFKSVEKGIITSNSLKPLKSMMDRCIAGSIVIFDDVKVKGPDDVVRPIAGMSLLLH